MSRRGGGLLEGLRGIVVGVGLGMGRSIALSMAREGASLGLISRSVERLKAICGEVEAFNVKCYYHAADATVKSSLEEAALSLTSSLGGVDVVVYNAGGWFSTSSVEELDEEFLLGALKSNIVGLFNTVKVFLEELAKTRGVLVVISASPKVILSGNAAYAAAKGGQVWMVKRLAKELAQKGIRVVAIGPGPTSKEPSPIEPEDPKLMDPKPHPAVYVGEAVVVVVSRKMYRLTGEYIALDGGLSIL